MLTKLKQLKKSYVMVAAVALAAGSLSTAAIAVGTSRDGSGAVSRFDAVEVNHPQDTIDPACTTSATYVDIPGMTKTFQQGGLIGSSQTVVMFQGQVNPITPVLDPGNTRIRLVVDNVVQGGSGAELDISLSPSRLPNLNSWNFFTDPLGSGNHTAKLQWKLVSTNPNEHACIQNRSMTILHR